MVKIQKLCCVVIALLSYYTLAWSEDDVVIRSNLTVERATNVTQNFLDSDERQALQLQALLPKAKAVIIVPDLINAGLVVGGKYGEAILLVKSSFDKNISWSYPAFFSLYGASFGLQAGAERSAIVMAVLSQKALDALYFDNVHIGGKFNVAVGDASYGVEQATTRYANFDIVAFSISEGLFLGLSLEGTHLKPNDTRNQAYYNSTNANAVNVVTKNQFSNQQAQALRLLLSSALP